MVILHLRSETQVDSAVFHCLIQESAIQPTGYMIRKSTPNRPLLFLGGQIWLHPDAWFMGQPDRNAICSKHLTRYLWQLKSGSKPHHCSRTPGPDVLASLWGLLWHLQWNWEEIPRPPEHGDFLSPWFPNDRLKCDCLQHVSTILGTLEMTSLWMGRSTGGRFQLCRFHQDFTDSRKDFREARRHVGQVVWSVWMIWMRLKYVKKKNKPSPDLSYK